MFSSANEPHFTLTLEGADFQVLAFEGREALNTPFAFELELVSEKSSLDLEGLLHKLAFLQLSPSGSGIHGLVYSIAQGEAGKRLTRYRISLRPKLAYLKHRINQRIFQQLTVPQIITQVLEEHGILASDHQFHLSTTYPERVYCVQYDESDLQFIQRLCEEEGIHYHFQHSSSGHTLVFGDDQTIFPKLPPVAYQQDNGLVADTPVIKRFELRLTTRTSRTTRRDYDFTKPRIELESDAKSAAQPDLEDYDYPGRFTDRQRGKHLANRALERHRSDYRLAEGRSDQPLLVSGHFLSLTEHTNAAWNDMWLLTEIFHEGKQPQVLEESVTSDTTDLKDDFHQGYRNRFTATPWDVPYRPPLNHPKPQVLGTQRAVVTGPEGEEIFCDQYGRVKVQFFWDREGQHDDKTSCWMRVASNWASQSFGSINLPRIGMEVLITFLEGDPDQPLLTGCLYHGVNLPPYKLPDFKTLATVKSKEYKGSRANELRIDDTTSEISIALRSDHGASAINLGYLTHPRPSGGQPRGEGFELRTDRHGAVRAAAGLLITTEPRPHESKHHKDLPETAERLATASDQQDGLGAQAREVKAQDAGDQDDVAKALHAQHQGILGRGPANMSANEFPEFTEPHLVLASPAGIAMSTPRSSHIATGEHLALSSTGHTSLSIGKRLLASASQGMRLFVQNLGWRLVAASGDIDIKALKDSINLLAKLNITANADRITITAKTELVIQGGGSATTYNAGGITHATPGPYTAHAANFAYNGAKSLAGMFPEPPKPGQGTLELFNQYANLQGIKGGDFEVVDALGKSLKGSLDAKGFASVSGAAPGPARVVFGKDPADTWSEGSYIGKPEWPREKPVSDDAPSSIQAMIANVLPTEGKAAALAEGGMEMARSGMAAVQQGMGVAQTAQGALQTAQQAKSALQAGAAGLPQLASLAGTALPSASSLLSAASKAGQLPTLPALPSLPSLPTFTPPTIPLKTADLSVGEMLS
ncbi:type VI secretion system Vgr family protein [Pseudomonas capsici]|uniref:type VI secretion system Vgr family protein n=1 Tax=Pseudomonas capsici TaxID=2810614 RepID=UPI0021F1C135|nr:type VI secretion system tip protein TssI/VgrG [Pseudomonas capsici]MCV4341780.1 type VI secretion system tip protein VgrG [Pseudomonas capsici]